MVTVTQVLSLNRGGGGQPVHVTTYWVSQLTEEGCNTIRNSGTVHSDSAALCH